jgi:hypothetical protein
MAWIGGRRTATATLPGPLWATVWPTRLVPPGARRLALTGPRIYFRHFRCGTWKKRLVRGKIAAGFPTPRRSCDRLRRASSSWVSWVQPLLATIAYALNKCPTSANGRREIASAARPAVST